MFPKFNKIKLKNGLEIYHIPFNKGSDVVNVNIYYKVGSKDEIMGKSGIAHMLEHMNFKSTKKIKAGEFDKIVKNFGGINNASTGFDYTKYYVKCSSKNLEKVIELYAEIMQNLSLNDKEFKTERDVVLEERLWRTDNDPFGYMFFRLFNHAFLRHPYHWTPIGFKCDIENFNLSDIKSFHAKFYQPQNAFIIICGDVTQKSAFELGKKYFQHIKNTTTIDKADIQEPKQDGEKAIIINKENTKVQYLAMGFKNPEFKNSAHLYLDATEILLSDGKSAILNETLIQKENLANSIYVSNIRAKDPNLFTIFAVCNENISAQTVKNRIMEILDELKNGKISKKDIEKVKNIMKTKFIYKFDSAIKVASFFGEFIAQEYLDEIYKLENDINNLNIDEFIKYLNLYFIKNNLTTLILKKDS